MTHTFSLLLLGNLDVVVVVYTIGKRRCMLMFFLSLSRPCKSKK